jgi:hypothetical protein
MRDEGKFFARFSRSLTIKTKTNHLQPPHLSVRADTTAQFLHGALAESVQEPGRSTPLRPKVSREGPIDQGYTEYYHSEYFLWNTGCFFLGKAGEFTQEEEVFFLVRMLPQPSAWCDTQVCPAPENIRYQHLRYLTGEATL